MPNAQSVVPIPIYDVRDRKMSAKKKEKKKGINPSLARALGEDTVIPPVVDVQVQLFRPLPELSHTTVTKPSDWRTLIWTWDARDKRSD